jgi:hypothetical protein
MTVIRIATRAAKNVESGVITDGSMAIRLMCKKNPAIGGQCLANGLVGMVRVNDGGTLMDAAGPIEPLSTNFALLKL